MGSAQIIAYTLEEAMQRAGLPAYHLSPDGRIHRFGKKKQYWGVNYGEVAVFGDWCRSLRQIWHRSQKLQPYEIRKLEVKIAASQKAELLKAENTRKYAYKLFKNAISIEGTIAEEYLAIRRIYSVPSHAQQLLRFVPSLSHNPSNAFYPCLLVAIQHVNKKFAGVQRIYLSPDGNGKAPVISPKMNLGKVGGAAIQLTPAQPRLIITEGLEDALTILQACPEKAVWCGLGGNMPYVLFPKEVHHITIAADSDADAAGQKLAAKLSQRLLKEGRSAATAYPPAHAKDFNALIQGN